MIIEGKCPECHEKYKNVAIHIGSSSCEHPEIDDETMQSIKGVLLGDGTLKGNKNKYVRIAVKQKEYIEYLSDIWGTISNSISQRKDGLWRIATVSHRQISELSKWYKDEKVIPNSLELTPIIARHWYVSDGTLTWDKRYNRARVGLCVDRHSKRSENAKVLLQNAGYDVWKNGDKLYLNLDQSEKFLNWIGDPLPGYEYKWKNQNYREYKGEIND